MDRLTRRLRLILAGALAGAALAVLAPAIRAWWRSALDPTPRYPNDYGVRVRPLTAAEHRAYLDRLAALERAAAG